MNKVIKNWAIGAGVLLLLTAIIAFCLAVWTGINTIPSENKIKVYINENDTIIEQLQTDVQHLTELLEEMQNDSVVVTVSRVPTNNLRPMKSEE